MPAPDDLTTQTPGAPLATMTPLAGAISDANTGNPNANETLTANAQAPTFVAKHNGGGRWIIVDAQGERFSEFMTNDKAEAETEALRLIDGGSPYVKPDDSASQATSQTLTTGKPDVVDPTKLKAAVMTSEGWLCPEPPAAKE
ncbi:hypothetical protein V2K77_01875 [Pseudomonas alliivorans]|nr:hypothetical protein [Pseudomonas alliivorans]MEE4710190.1 hypothetical protein [Pseudomonas alliivorans]MEE4725203.1 hypothetical protein [Pseudomonas alliivorans]MEE4765936.1 hypothetical protein [Pseudomonas alliivorans]